MDSETAVWLYFSTPGSDGGSSELTLLFFLMLWGKVGSLASKTWNFSKDFLFSSIFLSFLKKQDETSVVNIIVKEILFF